MAYAMTGKKVRYASPPYEAARGQTLKQLLAITRYDAKSWLIHYHFVSHWIRVTAEGEEAVRLERELRDTQARLQLMQT